MPNTELAKKVMAHIDAHPEQHDQRFWAMKTNCGTACCFAGLTVALSEGAGFDGFDFIEDTATDYWQWDPSFPEGEAAYQVHVSVLAQRLLDIDDNQAVQLFKWSNSVARLHDLVGLYF